ncbi:MAG: M56 family metallopeptidase [Bacteroidota bacterium]
METFIIYLIKASGLVVLFYTAYYLLLKKETFFTPNRWFLLSGLVTSAILPLIEFTKTIWVAPRPALPLSAANLQRILQYTDIIKQEQPEITLIDIVLGIYCAGMLLCLARLITDVSFIKEIITANKAVKQGKFRLIDSPQAESPFSFFNYIVYNAASLQPQELESILAHEKVHSTQRHSADMIIGQLFCVVFWFNPFVWLYKKAIAQNLEFIADAGATNQVQDAVAYQKTLLKITMQPACIAITNHFYQSLIKKRIIMLNKEKSKTSSSWKYALVLPALAAFMLAFQVKVVAQEKAAVHKSNDLIMVQEITKDTKDSELEENKKLFKQEFDADVTISNVARNGKSEITAITVDINLKGGQKKYNVKGKKPIETFEIVLERDANGSINAKVGTPASIEQHTAVLALPGNAVYADTIVYTKNHQIIEPISVSTAYAVNGPSSNVALNLGNTDALVVINGIKYISGQEIKLPAGQQITSITTLNNKEGKAKYGKEGKKGVVEITSATTGIAYSYVMPRDTKVGDLSINTGENTLEFNWENFTSKDIAYAMEQLNGVNIQLDNNDFMSLELRERANIMLEDIFSENGAEKAEAKKAKAFSEVEKRKAELEQTRAGLEKKRAAAEKERKKAEEIRRARKAKQ